jgi:hypothetical protein
METSYGVKLHTSAKVDGRTVPWSLYYVGRGKDGEVKTNTKPFNAAFMTEGLANLLVAKLNSTGHHAEVCELLCDENSTIHDNMVGLGEEAQPPDPPPTSLAELSHAIEKCLQDHLSPLEVLTFAIKIVLCC